MKNNGLILLIICLNIKLVNCVPRRTKHDTTHIFHKTGEAIAFDNYVQNYEKEHQKLYQKEIKNDEYLKWPALENKNLSNYCRNYLQYSIPSRTNDNIIGVKRRRTLHYEKQNKGISSKVIVLWCKIMYKSHPSFYYITRAQDSNCVFALKNTGRGLESSFTIINKYCDFEVDVSINNSLKRKTKEVTGSIHLRTGQPIAKHKYLLEYELEHQELLTKEGENGKYIEWSYAMTHHNLDSYCSKYMKVCAPNRSSINQLGRWKTENLHYEKSNINQYIYVTAVTCKSSKETSRRYHMTRSLEENCVYALVRKGFSQFSPLVIIFKHCDFENENHQKLFTEDKNILKTNVILKTEIKEETADTLEMLQLFPDV